MSLIATHCRQVLVGAVAVLCAPAAVISSMCGVISSIWTRRRPPRPLTDLPYERISVPSDQTFWIDEKSPVVDFGPEGKSYVKAFELPVGTYRVQIRSYSLRDGLFDAAMFFPAAVLLDGDKKSLDKGGPWTQHRGGIFSDEPNESIFMEDVEWVKPEKPYRYIVIYTTPGLIAHGGVAALQNPVQVAAASYHYVPIFIPSGPSGPIPVRGSAVGFLSIKLEPTKPN